jgi:signal transduction histidine kinase
MKHLSRMVSDMLTLARSDTPDWPLAPTDFYLDELLAEAVRAMTLLANTREVTLQVICPEELQMRADEGLLHQMLVNLIENAIRHTPAKGTVRVTVTPTAHSGLTVSVEDTGHGVPDSDRDRIFDRFVRSSPADAPSSDGGGTGLGLAIARRIARAHQGDLRLVSTGPTGTVFTVTLPVAYRPASVQPHHVPASA